VMKAARASQVVLLAGILAGIAYAGTPCPNPKPAKVVSGKCNWIPGNRTLPGSYGPVTAAITQNGGCISPGNSSSKCGETNVTFTYTSAENEDPCFGWPGHWNTCNTWSSTCVRISGVTINEVCDYDRCDPVVVPH
jgi:hypothetical protein